MAKISRVKRYFCARCDKIFLLAWGVSITSPEGVVYGRGRKRLYCCNACKQAAYRDRKRVKKGVR